MDSVFLDFIDGNPQFKCTKCNKCTSLFGESLNKTKNRGCCWYYPKFTLYEIQKMVKEEEGIKTLHKIISNKKSVVYNYYIHAIGDFDRSSYLKYLRSPGKCNLDYATQEQIDYVNNSLLEEEKEEFEYDQFEEFNTKCIDNISKPRVIHDKTIFFRTCPFVENNVGCTIEPQYRSYICNLFICDEINLRLENNEVYDSYLRERDNLIRWIDYENTTLQIYLEEKNLNLINNFDEVISILKDMNLEEYDFPKLQKIIINEQLVYD